ncbi:SPOR domain-containing protein [Lacibacter sediminis]|uniref:SPOR domain-containing protein n=1 Tax=Lacibacter sediminis TaxID=2760713 RepID=A0A7G5XIM0_9BACT|nr:SPOR domain-containing protein [Lacibacter sediminis]QNA45323.1 SPOR domain-containing protein [Lacibacter sediminis]
MKKIILFCLIVSVASISKAQMVVDTVGANVFVMKDSRFDLLVKKKAEINKKSADAKKPNKGYRIQVLNTTDRNQALATKSKLLTLYPEQKTYLMYTAPYFKIRIGNFVEKSEADELKKELARMFPTGVFVIPSDIEYKAPPEKEENIK